MHVRKALETSLNKDNNLDLILIIDTSKRRAPKTLRHSTEHLVDQHLVDSGSRVRAQGSVAYEQADALIDEMVQELSVKVPAEVEYDDLIPIRNKLLDFKKDMYWLFSAKK
ncbi:MAG: hypothetical protein OYH77_04005 [Pseudomonadota bacterium]|nr:hypothetical protein [Pseudomonadota bacterium]